jgi:hypothetical protein
MSFFAYMCVQNPSDREKKSVQKILQDFGLVFKVVNLAKEFGVYDLYGLNTGEDLFEIEFVSQDVELLLLGESTFQTPKEIPLIQILDKLEQTVAARPIVFNLDPDFELRLGRYQELRGMQHIISELQQLVHLGDLTQCVRLVIV